MNKAMFFVWASALVSLVFVQASAAYASISVRQGTADCTINNICFVIDESGSISSRSFATEIAFVEDMGDEIAAVSSGPMGATYSAVFFSSTSRLVQPRTTDLNGVFKPAIRAVVQRRGGTDIGPGLQLCFDEIRNAPGTRAIALITDGRDGRPSNTQIIGDRVKMDNIAIVTVGVGPSVDMTFLENLATEPKFFISSSSFGQLPQIVMDVTDSVCDAIDVADPTPSPTTSPTSSPTPIPTPSPSPCPIDNVCFAIDGSSSVSNSEFSQEKDFVEEIATYVSTRSSNTLYSAHTFADDVSAVSSPGTMDLLGAFLPLVDALALTEGTSNVFSGVRSCFEDLRLQTGTKMMVVVTDGRDNGNPKAVRVADVVENAGIAIITVGIGNRVQANYLKKLASAQEFFIGAADFGALPAKVAAVAEDLCMAASMMPTSPPPTDPCEAEYNKCLLRFNGQSGLRTFRLKRPGKRFTPAISTKLGLLFPGRWKSIRPSVIRSDGTRKKLPRDTFTLSDTGSPYGVVRTVTDSAETERLKGKCISLALRLKNSGRLINRCVVFRVLRD